MQVGDLVRHIEHGYIGILVKRGNDFKVCNRWLVHWCGSISNPWFVTTQYYGEQDLEAVCK